MPQQLSEEQIKEINEKTDIVKLVSEYVSLTKSGADYKGLCPFHDEKTPSFMVSPSKNIAVCMGCHNGGTPIKFLMQIRKISFLEACQDLATRAGITLPISYKKTTGPDYSRYYKIFELATNFYNRNLVSTSEGKEALSYLKNRGIDLDLIEKFQIGLAPKNMNLLYELLKSADISEADMLELGLIKSNEHGFYDLFQNRIMFPIKDEEGHIIAFSGRVFNNPDKNQAKYINSPESIIFKKGNTFFNLSNAIGSIRRTGRVILHEGQMDVIASVKAGFNEAVCSLGTAFTKNHAHILKKYADNIIVCYDGDNAGINAMDKAISILDELHFNIKLVVLPNGMDPDEYVNKYGTKKFNEYISYHQMSIIDFKYELAIRNKKLSNPSEIEEAKQNIFNILKNEKSNVLIESILKKFSNDSLVSFEALYQDFSATSKIIPSTPRLPKESLISNNLRSPYQDTTPIEELSILRYLMTSKEKAEELDSVVEENFKLDDCISLDNQFLWNQIMEFYKRYHTFDKNLFLMDISSDEHLLNIFLKNEELLNSRPFSKLGDKDLDDCIHSLYILKFKKKANVIQEKIEKSNGNITNDELIKLLEEKRKSIQTINKLKNNKKVGSNNGI